MMRKKSVIGALGCAAVVAAGCATTPTALERGIGYYHEGHYLFAADEFSEAIRLDPNLASAYVNRGVARVRLGRLTAAIEDYNRALALQPDDAATYFNRGNALVAAGHPVPAIADFTRAVELSPVFAKAWFNRGSARALAGQTDGAMLDWLHAIEVESDPWSRAGMRRSAGLEPGSAVTSEGTPTTAATVAPPPAPGTATAAVPVLPPGTPAGTPAASPPSPESDARALAIRAFSREVDGDREGALRDLRAALAVETDPARRRSLEALLRRLDAPR
jgi:tetratricopeptide (TPR) repeat protein